MSSATVLPMAAPLFQRGSHFAVRVERPKGLRLGPLLNEMLHRLRGAGTPPKDFHILPGPLGTVVLEWLFAREDEARAFAEAIASVTHGDRRSETARSLLC